MNLWRIETMALRSKRWFFSGLALLVLGTLAGLIQLLDAGVGLLQHDLGKAIGPLVIAAFQFFAVSLLNRSTRSSVQ